MASVAHFIITRFNLRPKQPSTGKQLDVQWLTERFDLFDRFCYPTVKGQTEQDFRWLVLFDEDTPEPIRSRIRARQAWPNFVPIFLPPGVEQVGRKVVADQLAEHWAGTTPDLLITTRLDNDDGMCRTYIEEIRRHAKVKENTVLQFPVGYVWCRDRIYHDRQDHNAFTTLVEVLGGKADANFSTIYKGSHSDVHKLGKVISISDEPAWVQVVHGGNLENQVRGVRHAMSELGQRFDIEHKALAANENALEMRWDQARTGLKAAVLGALRAVWHAVKPKR